MTTLYWFLFTFLFLMHCTVLLTNLEQIETLLKLRLGNLNPFEAMANINKWILTEFIVQGLLCILFLLTGHWVMFLVAFPVTWYHVKRFLKQEHLIDITEDFRNLNVEMEYRFFKFAMYLLLYVIFVLRYAWMVLYSGNDDNLLS